MSDETPRVWVGCLGCYNAGNLVGEWFDANDAPEEMAEFSPRVFGAKGAFGQAPDGHAEEMHEELWVFDHEGFDGLLTGECSPSEAKRITEFIESLDYRPLAAVAAFAANNGDKPTEIDLDDFDEAYCGEWGSEEEYAQDLAEEIGALPREFSWPQSYIDWDAATDALFMEDYWSADAPGGCVYVFRSI